MNFKEVKLPAGDLITSKEGQLVVGDHPIIGVLRGDGTGQQGQAGGHHGAAGGGGEAGGEERAGSEGHGVAGCFCFYSGLRPSTLDFKRKVYEM